MFNLKINSSALHLLWILCIYNVALKLVLGQSSSNFGKLRVIIMISQSQLIIIPVLIRLKLSDLILIQIVQKKFWDTYNWDLISDDVL